MSKPKLIE
jgi:hypothetical protein